MKNQLVLPSSYLPPIPHFAAIMQSGEVLIEQHDNYVKQTYRNRCAIAGPNGIQILTVPVEKPEGYKCSMKDLRISDHGNWRHLHWNALESSYGKSPFFEYYADDLRPFYEEHRWTYLYDYNTELTETLLGLLDIDNVKLQATDHYMQADLHRWAEPSALNSRPCHPYYQVFAQKQGFIPNLSIVDLLFNMGPEAVIELQRS